MKQLPSAACPSLLEIVIKEGSTGNERNREPLETTGPSNRGRQAGEKNRLRKKGHSSGMGGMLKNLPKDAFHKVGRENTQRGKVKFEEEQKRIAEMKVQGGAEGTGYTCFGGFGVDREAVRGNKTWRKEDERNETKAAHPIQVGNSMSEEGYTQRKGTLGSSVRGKMEERGKKMESIMFLV